MPRHDLVPLRFLLAGSRDAESGKAAALDIKAQELRKLLGLAYYRIASEPMYRDTADDDAVQLLLEHIFAISLNIPPTAGSATSPGDGESMAQHHIQTLRTAVLDIVAEGELLIEGRHLAELLQAMDEVSATVFDGSPGEFVHHLASADSVNALIEVAHDMRSPLSSILFLVDTLRRGQSGPVTAVQERQLGLIYGAALGLNTLASDVIDAMRGGHRLVDGPPVPFSLSDVVMAVCDTVRPISEEKGLPINHMVLALDGRMGYPAALSRVLLNLTANALKYTTKGSVAIGCEDISASRVSFFVKDTGDGIPPQVLAMLFDGFRPSASGPRFSNAGLGLAICESFLASMGSTLKVESGPRTGTAFSFELDLPRA